MRNSYLSAADPRDDTIRHLRDELFMARQTILSLTTPDQQGLLKSYYDCETRQDSYRWESDVAEKLIEGAIALPREQGSYFGPRAFCPLCGDGTSSPYETGFSLPEGLRRHLVGWGGRANQCVVLSTAIRLANDHWNGKFKETELREQAQKGALEQARKATETLFLVNPYGPPELSDAQTGFGAKARTVQELDWAESRLAELGFLRKEDTRVRSYVKEGTDFAVFADPRRLGEISFAVYRLPLPKRRPQGARYFTALQQFRIPDSWKNDLKSKYEKRVLEAINALERARKP